MFSQYQTVSSHMEMSRIVTTDQLISQLAVTLLLDFFPVETVKVAYHDVVGIPAVLLCLELAIISVLHLSAFSAKSYRSPASKGERIRICCTAIADVLNPMDMMKAMSRNRSWESVPETESSVQETPVPHQRSPKEDTQDTVSYVELMEWIRSAPRS